MTLEFLITSLIIIVLPGTGVVYTLEIALSAGFMGSVLAALGCTIGILPAMAASITGLAAVLQTREEAFQALQYGGAGYLLFMAWSMLRSQGTLGPAPVAEKGLVGPPSALSIVRNGFLLNVLNPKLALFFLAFLPQFIPTAGAHSLTPMLILGLVFMALTFLTFVLYGAFAAAARDIVTARPAVQRGIKRCFAVAFILLALRLLLSHA